MADLIYSADAALAGAMTRAVVVAAASGNNTLIAAPAAGLRLAVAFLKGQRTSGSTATTVVSIKAGTVTIDYGAFGDSIIGEIFWDAASPFSDGTLGQALLAPTRLYVKQALSAIRAGGVHALAHITGGGLTENLPRVLPEGLGATIDLSSWPLPPVFRWLAETANMAEPELLKTFNCGIGMICVVDAAQAPALKALLEAAGETVTVIGTVTEGQGVAYTGKLL